VKRRTGGEQRSQHLGRKKKSRTGVCPEKRYVRGTKKRRAETAYGERALRGKSLVRNAHHRVFCVVGREATTRWEIPVNKVYKIRLR